MSNGKMSTSRVEAFSDGVIAIIVTVMVLQLTHPAQPTLAALLRQSPIFLSYALSFLVVAIMWVNHHHLIHAVREVSARLLWANLNLLFWMSLIPFVTDFLGRNPRVPFPVSLYGFDLAMCGFAFWLLRIELVRQHRHDPEMSEYHARVQLKNLFSAFLYLSAGALAHVSIYISYFVYVLIPMVYFLPEKKLASAPKGSL
jgi:TMEM175 potassium channel family protein